MFAWRITREAPSRWADDLLVDELQVVVDGRGRRGRSSGPIIA